MSSTTNNGWPKDPAVQRVFVGNDHDGCEFRAGDVAVVFQYFFERFHNEVEPVRALNGYRSSSFNASIPGSVSSSNHVSATAGDVNGAQHPNEAAPPRGIKPSGFSAAQEARIRVLLADFGCIKWGGDFPVRSRDYMHFELLPGSSARVSELAAWIRAQNAPKPKPPTPTPTPVPSKKGTRMFFALDNGGRGRLLLPDGSWVWIRTTEDSVNIKASGVPTAPERMSAAMTEAVFPADRARN